MLMYDLPSVLMPLIADGAPYPCLYCRMILFHSCKTPEPVGERQVAAHEDTKVAHLCSEGDREAGQARIPSAAQLICIFDFLEQRFHVEDDGLRCVMAHDSIRIFRANSGHLIANELSNLGFVEHFCGFGYHRYLLYFKY